MKRLNPLMAQGSAAVAAIAVMMASWQWGYQAAARAYTKDLHRVTTLKEQLAQVEAMVQATGGEAAWRTHSERRLSRLKARVPQQSQLPQLLNTLVETLKAGEIKVLNVEQGNLEPVREADAPLLIDGAPCYRLSVTVTAEGRYHAVREALERISAESFPCLLSVDHVDLLLQDPAGSRLAATVRLYLYVVGTSPMVPSNA